eukprot:4356971-Prymnesium_polylepis.1
MLDGHLDSAAATPSYTGTYQAAHCTRRRTPGLHIDEPQLLDLAEVNGMKCEEHERILRLYDYPTALGVCVCVGNYTTCGVNASLRGYG